LIGTKWFTGFNLTFMTDVLGCAPPCTNSSISMHVDGPTGANVSIAVNGTMYYPTICTWMNIGNPVTLAANMTIPLYSLLHFDTVGKYEICFNMTCPPGTPSCGTTPPCVVGPLLIAEKCYDFAVYQWKDAFKIPLYRKWNLISLPLVPLVDPPIDPILDAYAFKSEILSVWYFDQCDDKWYVYPAGTPGADAELTDMEDGKGYWIRIKYDVANPAGTPLDGLWVWGTDKPVPPASPSAYPVCTGWNMIGFTSLGNMWDSVYLWNFPFPGAHGAVYGWWAPTQTWFNLCHDAVVLWPGEGYWASFGLDGTIFPP
jgi:hypothetical protein